MRFRTRRLVACLLPTFARSGVINTVVSSTRWLEPLSSGVLARRAPKWQPQPENVHDRLARGRRATRRSRLADGLPAAWQPRRRIGLLPEGVPGRCPGSPPRSSAPMARLVAANGDRSGARSVARSLSPSESQRTNGRRSRGNCEHTAARTGSRGGRVERPSTVSPWPGCPIAKPKPSAYARSKE